jgi:hypothetical protein
MRTSRRNTRALSLMMTLWISSLILIMGLVLSSLATSHIQFGARMETHIKAETACEAAISLALEKITSDPEYGIHQEVADAFSFEVNDATVHLSFNPGKARAWNIPLSESNRFNIDSILSQDGTIIPPRSVRLIAVARCGAAEKTIEVIVHSPEFPYAMAANGPLLSDGKLLIGSVNSLKDLQSSLSPNSLSPGDLVSNHSINISGDALITGTVRSHGRVDLSNSVSVQGSVQEFTDKTEITDIDIPSLRPAESFPFQPKPGAIIDDSRHFNDPSLHLTGGLTLDQGVLYVNGDLHISGGLQGMGAIVCNGDVTIDGGATFAADDQVALVASGDVNIRGRGKESSVFQGLIYTEGDLNAESTTLLGVFVANGQSTRVNPGSHISLKDTNLIYYPEYGEFHLDGTGYLFFRDPAANNNNNNNNLNNNNNNNSSGPVTVRGYTSDPSGEKELFLFSVDERKAAEIEAARGQEITGGPTPEQEERKGWNFDLQHYVSLTKGRKAISKDGVLISDFIDLTPQEITDHIITMQGGPPGRSGAAAAADYSQLFFKNFQADPDLKIIKQIRTSFFLDLNKFLATESRTRIIYWNTY